MIFNKKNIFVVILSFTVFDLNLNATTADELELITAFLRIPAAIGVNTLDKQLGTAPKVMHIVSDLIRLSNEMLSSANKRGEYDFHCYDYCWGAYDAYSLIAHVKSLFSDESKQAENIESEESKKFALAIKSLHELILPLVEGMAAILKTSSDDFFATSRLSELKDQAFRNRCGAILSLSRLLDNLIVSKPNFKNTEFYVYIMLLAANIGVAFGIDGELRPLVAEARSAENAREKKEEEDFRRSQEEFRRKFFGGGFENFGADLGGRESERRRACEVLGISLTDGEDPKIVGRAFRREAKKSPARISELGAARDVLIPRSGELIPGEGSATGI